MAAFPLLADGKGLVDEWRRLVVAHDCTSQPAHDARLVAAITLNGISRIATFNAADFARYPNITVLDPTALTASTPPAP